MTEVILKPRNQTIADLVMQCAEGKLPFSGPDSLYSKVRAMGYSGNSLYEMVREAERSLPPLPARVRSGHASKQDEEADEACQKNRE